MGGVNLDAVKTRSLATSGRIGELCHHALDLGYRQRARTRPGHKIHYVRGGHRLGNAGIARQHLPSTMIELSENFGSVRVYCVNQLRQCRNLVIVLGAHLPRR